MASISKTTYDHDTVRQWVIDRGGVPAAVKGTGDNADIGMLRIKFPDYRGTAALTDISWDQFFQKFEDKQLALLYQETTSDGKLSRFFKFVHRPTLT